MPGWNSRQWAYHADDGMTYAESGAGRRYSHEWGEGDVVGCGVDVGPGGTGTIFFMKNGQYLSKSVQPALVTVPFL
jgi:Ran-binding protein 9/10